jgi:predicted anti-sigma-YlaC factor YlaD
MRCKAAKRQIELKLDRELEPGRIRKLDQHLSSCPACRAYQDEGLKLQKLLQAQPRAEFPAWLHHQIMEKTARHDRQRKQYKIRWRLQTIPALLVLILMFTVGGLLGKAAFSSFVPFPETPSATPSQELASFGEVSLLDDPNLAGGVHE